MPKFKRGDVAYLIRSPDVPIRKAVVAKRRGRWENPQYDVDVYWTDEPEHTYRDTVPEKQLLTYDEAIVYRLAGKT